jgi:tight adherence protein B
MAVLAIAFTVTLMLMLGGLMLALKPTRDQKEIHRRLGRLKTDPGNAQAGSGQIGDYLTAPGASGFKWLEDRLANSSFSESIKELILQSDGKGSVGGVIIGSVGFAAVGLLLGFLFIHIWYAAVGAGALLSYVPIAVLKFKASRRIALFNKGLPVAIDMMARSLRAGHSMASAIGIVADQSPEPVKSEFAEIYKKSNFGIPMRDALMEMLDRVPSQDLRVLVTGILVQKDTGGNLVDILDRIVHVIRERLRIQGEISTHTAQGRLTGWILCSLPVVMLVLINMVNPGYSKVLLTEPIGQKLLGAGVVLLIVGGLLIRGIINGIEV